MIFRKAVLEDIKELNRLLSALFSQEAEFVPDAQKQAKALTMIINDDSIGDIFVAQKEGKVVGMVNILYTISTALGERVAILEDMIVDEAFRGQNIGSALIEHAVAKTKAAGCKRITLLTDGDNTKAHGFYGGFGFVKSSMVPFRLQL